MVAARNAEEKEVLLPGLQVNSCRRVVVCGRRWKVVVRRHSFVHGDADKILKPVDLRLSIKPLNQCRNGNVFLEYILPHLFKI